MAICGICDETYQEGTERAKVHEHPEPQSGRYREAWLRSGLPYQEWAQTFTGREWVRLSNFVSRGES